MDSVLLWLFVVNLGVAFGAGLYEHRIVVSRWIATAPGARRRWDSEAARRDDTGRRFWAFVTTGPLTLLALANLAAAWHASGALRTWWLAGAAAARKRIDALYRPLSRSGARLLATYSTAELAAALRYLEDGRRLQRAHAQRLRRSSSNRA